MKHRAVLYKEVIENIIPTEKAGSSKGGSTLSFLDATLGAGGHSWGILSNVGSVNLTALDIDQNALENFERKLIEQGFKRVQGSGIKGQESCFEKNTKKVTLFKNNFGTFEMSSNSYDGILADLGWSSDQLDSLEGLSYKGDGALDMRFNDESAVKASDLLNVFNTIQLEKMFTEYADIRNPKLKELIEKIDAFRKKKAFSEIKDLNSVIESMKSVKPFEKRKFYSQVYQALRIAVNSEYSNLKTFLENASKALKKDGKLLVITFHSGEENIVNNFLKNSNMTLVKTIRPSVEELKENIRAASSKLFIIQN